MVGPGPGPGGGAQTVDQVGRFRDLSALFVMALRERKVVELPARIAWLLFIEPVSLVLF